MAEPARQLGDMQQYFKHERKKAPIREEEFGNDQELIQDYLNGNEKALELLWEKHKRIVWKTIISIEKDRAIQEEIMQEVFIKLYLNLDKYKKEKNIKFTSWLTTLTRNLATTFQAKKFRKNRNAKTIGGRILERLNIPVEADSEKLLSYKEVLEAIEALPANQKDALKKYYFEGQTQKDIAKEIGGITAAGINVRIKTAIATLKEKFS